MYEIYTSNKKTEKMLDSYILSRGDILNKLEKLKSDPRKECGAHPLHGKLKGKWACWFGSNIRMIYEIDDYKRIIWIEYIGTHKIY